MSLKDVHTVKQTFHGTYRFLGEVPLGYCLYKCHSFLFHELHRKENPSNEYSLGDPVLCSHSYLQCYLQISIHLNITQQGPTRSIPMGLQYMVGLSDFQVETNSDLL